MFSRIFKILLVITYIFVFSFFFVFAQTNQEDERLKLEKELKELEERIKQYEKDISKTEAEKKDLKNQIINLKNKIEKLDLEIEKSNRIINDLSKQIKNTQSSIEANSLKIEDLKRKLSEIIRNINKEDEKSIVEILLAERNISGFFDSLTALNILHQKNQELLKNIKILKSNLEDQKKSLDEEKEELGQAVKVRTLQKQQSEAVKKEREVFLNMTEAQYQKYLKEKKELEEKVKEITARITQLTLPGLTVPQNKKELYELAKWAGNAAGGVRPALILGLIEVESALGINVGQCNCAGQPVCRYPELTYKQVMPKSQWNSFEAITKELNLNINSIPVSCYVAGGSIQMGGAMGPAQFMPNTWLNLGYKQRIENITGIKPANPWRAADAFLAAALYLADWNATSQSRESEMKAATAYLCGTGDLTPACRRAGGEWYRNLVMSKADQWQQWINEGSI